MSSSRCCFKLSLAGRHFLKKIRISAPLTCRPPEEEQEVLYAHICHKQIFGLNPWTTSTPSISSFTMLTAHRATQKVYRLCVNVPLKATWMDVKELLPSRPIEYCISCRRSHLPECYVSLWQPCRFSGGAPTSTTIKKQGTPNREWRECVLLMDTSNAKKENISGALCWWLTFSWMLSSSAFDSQQKAAIKRHNKRQHECHWRTNGLQTRKACRATTETQLCELTAS